MVFLSYFQALFLPPWNLSYLQAFSDLGTANSGCNGDATLKSVFNFWKNQVVEWLTTDKVQFRMSLYFSCLFSLTPTCQDLNKMELERGLAELTAEIDQAVAVWVTIFSSLCNINIETNTSNFKLICLPKSWCTCFCGWESTKDELSVFPGTIQRTHVHGSKVYETWLLLDWGRKWKHCSLKWKLFQFEELKQQCNTFLSNKFKNKVAVFVWQIIAKHVAVWQK